MLGKGLEEYLNKKLKKSYRYLRMMRLKLLECNLCIQGRGSREHLNKKMTKLKLVKCNLCIWGIGCRERLERKLQKFQLKKKCSKIYLNKLRRKEAIFDQIINQLPPNNDTYYINNNKKKDTFTVKKDVKRRPILKRKYNSVAAAVNEVKKKYAKLDRRRKNNWRRHWQ